MTDKTQHTPDLSQPCIEWVGVIDNDGYGRLNVKNKWRLAHRVEYERLVGTITEGLVIDHLCRNRRCVNVNHMEVVSNKENVLRGSGISAKNAVKEYCKNGHKLPDSINGKRRCLICARRRWREYRLREIEKGTWSKT